MRRVPSIEWLDHDSGTGHEVRQALLDLRMFNRWFGGVHTTYGMLCRAARANGAAELTMLEVAAGAGYVAQRCTARLESRGIRLAVTLLDRAPSHLNRESPAVVADARALPFRDGSFDVVSCCLFVHHLGPRDAVAFASEALRVCRVGALINDLVRSRVHLAFAYAGFPLYRSRITRNDAPASVRQAYTIPEMRSMLQQAGAARVEIVPRYFFRMAAMAWKTNGGAGGRSHV